jgi:hypothetical protein
MPKYRPIPKLTPKDLMRFWSKVDKKGKNDCWPWLAGCTYDGYGQFSIGSTGYRSSRIALAIAGFRSNTLETRHLCNNPSCCNPWHLAFGTPVENGQDQRTNGSKKGSKHNLARLIETDIPIIRKLVSLWGHGSQVFLAKLFCVTHSTIGRIISGEHWTHVIGVATDKEVKAFLRKRKINLTTKNSKV